MARLSDTIVAPITALGGAVAVVRLSGQDAWRICGTVFKSLSEAPEPMRAYYGTFAHGDDGVVTLFEGGYTGEQSAEMSVHGSPASVSTLVDLCLREGARNAEPGEFSLRAFMNGRLDLTQAEGVRASVEALTDAQLRRGARLRAGDLASAYSPVSAALLAALAAIEAHTDFSEETGDLDAEGIGKSLAEVAKALEGFIEDAKRASMLDQGVTIAIVGLPNAGKSSLLNALLGTERAIVTPVAGTTRDTVEEVVEMAGLPCRLIDTAGLRETGDEVESIGISRTWRAIKNSDLVFYVFDSVSGWSETDEDLLAGIRRPTLVIANKSDRSKSTTGLPVSCIEKTGLADVSAWVEEQVGDLPELAPTSRHIRPLEAALEATASARKTLLDPNLPYDLAAVDLQKAIREMGTITGETATEDMLDRLFSSFCVGK